MSKDEVVMEAAATFTDKDVELYERATAAGIPTVIVSMYKTALQKLIADEREACAKVCEERASSGEHFVEGCAEAKGCADAIRARGEK